MCLNVHWMLVESNENRADRLTRVGTFKITRHVVSCMAETDSWQLTSLRELHNFHFCIERSYFPARMVNPYVQKEKVEQIVPPQDICSVPENWIRLAIDITHYRGKPVLTTIYRGPSRFTIWRELYDESAVENGESIRYIELRLIILGDTRNILSQHHIIKSRFRIGQQVWVKTSSARCTSRWTKGFVTDIQSESIEKKKINENIIKIDSDTEIEISDGDDQVYEDNSQEEQTSRPLRDRRAQS
ncbi:hypothetical protein GJ496_002400 [Pomphorhynchus laevis]|nr:hypothetical protein GJ496_002400 [Pomphorhynchus laevis]